MINIDCRDEKERIKENSMDRFIKSRLKTAKEDVENDKGKR